MKKIFILSLSILFGCFALNSCDPWEDDSYHEGSGDDVIIPGVWKLTEVNLAEPTDFNGDGTADPNLMTETNCYQNELISFLPDYTGIATSNSYADISLDGEDFVVECVEEETPEETTFTWEQNQDSIVLHIDDFMLNATLEGNKLSYTIPEGFQVSDSDSGDVEILQDISFVYTKQ